ncbi:uncharacterized protein LOC116991403 [Amblyraja radiata]|uniref:uncharacterized protein LOC116991403 n=1 Tax=Amblyraja radiata TaxID=386614 RepID=UPI0014036BE9|nr:uncharacterized protein LOC116991403 [Amblyraja radiata]
MKIFAVALVLLLIKESKGAAIPEDVPKTNKSTSWEQPIWDLVKLGHEIVSAAVSMLSKSDVAKTTLAKLSNNTGHVEDLFENVIKELYTLSKELEWKGVPMTQHIVKQGRMLQDQLDAVGSQVHEAIGNETYSIIHEKLGKIHSDVQQYRENLILISSQFNQTLEGTTAQVEKWHKRVTDYVEPLHEELRNHIEDLRKFLSPIIHNSVKD